MDVKRIFQRIRVVGFNALRQLIQLLGNAVTAYLVILWSSDTLWGGVVNDMILIALTVHVLGWGNKEYLLRAFSQRPSAIKKLFYSALQTRFVLSILPVVWAMFVFPSGLWVWIIIWLFAHFFYQSMEVLVLYKRAFKIAALAEIVGVTVIWAGLFIYRYQLTHDVVIKLFALSFSAKLLILLTSSVLPGWPDKWQLNWSYYKQALPFFLIGLSGLLVSKSDLYVVNYFLDDTAVGQYQVLISFLLMLQALVGFVLGPYTKNLYRLPKPSILKFIRLFSLAGVLIVSTGLPALYFILKHYYSIDLSISVICYAALFVFPIYIYSPMVYYLFKKGGEQKVMQVNFITTLINIITTSIVIGYMGYPGALLTSAIMQVLILIAYTFYFMNESEG